MIFGLRRSAFWLVAALFAVVLISPRNARAESFSYNTVSVDFPFDGGAVATYSRMWRMARYLDAGFFASAGEIHRNFSVQLPDGSTLDAHTEALVAPFVGPRLSLNFPVVGISVGYGAFWAKTDFKVDWPGAGTFTGTTRGWGGGFLSPLLVLDFLDKKHDLVWGLGLGGILGTSYPELEGSGPGGKIRTNASPIDALTFHVHVLWAGQSSSTGHGPRDDF